MLVLGEDSSAGCPYLIWSSVAEILSEGQVWGMCQGSVTALLSACNWIFTSCSTSRISAVLEQGGCDTDLTFTRTGKLILLAFQLC